MVPTKGHHAGQPKHLRPPAKAVGAHAVLLLDRAGWHTTGKLDVPENITPIFLPSRAPGAQPGRERLAVSAPELALKHRLRKLRRHHRRRLRRLAKAHRSTRNDHLHRNARLGPRRSAAMTFGISLALATRLPLRGPARNHFLRRGTVHGVQLFLDTVLTEIEEVSK